MIWIIVVILMLWGTYVFGTMGNESTTKKPGDQLSQRGVTLVQSLFWITLAVSFVIVVVNSYS